MKPSLSLFPCLPWLLAVFCLAPHLPLSGADAPPIPGAVKATASQEIVRLHKLPDASSEAVAAVTKGESLWIVPGSEEWCRAVTEDGIRGWASQKAFAAAAKAAEFRPLAARGYTVDEGPWHALLGKEGWLTPPLAEILPPDDDSPGAPFFARDFTDSRFYLNDRGERLVPAEHNPEGPFRGGLARVRWGNTAYGFVDASLKLVIPANWDSAGNFSEGLAYVRKDLTQGYIDATGKLVLDVPYDVILSGDQEFQEGLVAYEGEGQLRGFLDRQGRRVLEPKWTIVTGFSEGFAAVTQDDILGDEPTRYHYIGRTGQALRSDEWSAEGPFSQGRAVVSPTGADARQFIDATGKVVGGGGTFSIAASFSEGLAAVGDEDGVLGYVNLEGHLVIPHQFEWAGSFTNGHAWVRRDGRYAIIDKTGQPIAGYFEALSRKGKDAP